MRTRRLNSSDQPVCFFMANSNDHLTGKTGLEPSVLISKNAAPFAPPAGSVFEIGYGWYALEGNAEDRDTLGTLIIHAEASGADPFDMDILIEDALGKIPDIKTVSDALDTMLEADGGLARFTEAALGNAPSPEEIDSRLTAEHGEGSWTTYESLEGTIEYSDVILDLGGDPVPGVRVIAYTDPDRNTVAQSVFTDSNGAFTLHLLPGIYYLRAAKVGYSFPDWEKVCAFGGGPGDDEEHQDHLSGAIEYSDVL